MPYAHTLRLLVSLVNTILGLPALVMDSRPASQWRTPKMRCERSCLQSLDQLLAEGAFDGRDDVGFAATAVVEGLGRLLGGLRHTGASDARHLGAALSGG